MASRNQRKKRRANARNASTQDHQHGRAARGTVGSSAPHDGRASSETKSALRTTELIAYAGTVLAIVITALALDADGDGGADPFGAEPALRYITYLTVGYLVARGLAKSGSWNTGRHDDTADDDHEHDHAVSARDGSDQDSDPARTSGTPTAATAAGGDDPDDDLRDEPDATVEPDATGPEHAEPARTGQH